MKTRLVILVFLLAACTKPSESPENASVTQILHRHPKEYELVYWDAYASLPPRDISRWLGDTGTCQAAVDRCAGCLDATFADNCWNDALFLIDHPQRPSGLTKDLLLGEIVDNAAAKGSKLAQIQRPYLRCLVDWERLREQVVLLGLPHGVAMTPQSTTECEASRQDFQTRIDMATMPTPSAAPGGF